MTATGTSGGGWWRRLSPRGARLSDYLAQHPEAELIWVGFRIFKWLLALVVLMVGVLIGFGWMTYPDFAEVRSVMGGEAAGSTVAETLQAARAQWVADLKDLGQLFLLTPVFPLLGAVIGYIFGRSNDASLVTGLTNDDDPDV